MRAASRGLLSMVVVITAMAVVPAVALAATTYTDSIAGAEVYATSTEGRFAGAATGSLPGSWFIDVTHDPLTTTTPRITGGSFSLTTAVNGQLATVRGNFAGGSVTQTGGFSGCTNQTYALAGTLANVGTPSSGQSGTGSFTAVLTHYRHSVYGYCVTYSATVTGSLLLVF